MKAAWSRINKAVNGMNTISSLLYNEEDGTNEGVDPEEKIVDYTNSLLAKYTTFKVPKMLLYRINTLSAIANELNESLIKLKDGFLSNLDAEPSLRGNEWKSIDVEIQHISSEILIEQTDVICACLEVSGAIINYFDSNMNHTPPDEELERKYMETKKAYNSLNNVIQKMKSDYESEMIKKKSTLEETTSSLIASRSKISFLEKENKLLRDELESTKLTVSQVQKSLEIANEWNQELTKRVGEMKKELSENLINKDNYIDKRILVQMLKRGSESSKNVQTDEIIEILCSILGIDMNENRRSLTSEFLDFLNREAGNESPNDNNISE
ncbi:conserved Plasmodium protein, unknown function [Babesia microti strain RI]|uniref:Uncharacterized protein n=1 Tax=Babesia microti (strain RI) TaxID=1133968 RepID=I7IA25_BABMR|nr:conserved Plasmodium protein, unknown function [Babesia microti strain RI]CCF76024.1 conserved Plasmodium protein, unknown function [Babesia microti strain RI]|eukprot:XP_012650432.1 conserved Plasmodium protein, unknown function [Babesia microti strain RI]